MQYLKELQDNHGGTITYPIGIEFKWFVPYRTTDPDNICFAKKYILDGLQKANIIANDNWKIIKAFNDRFAIDKEKPRVEVSIYKIKDFTL